MPPVDKIALKYPPSEISKCLDQLLLLIQSDTKELLSLQAPNVSALKAYSSDLSWLHNQEINTLMSIQDSVLKLRFIAHRIRFSLLPLLRKTAIAPPYVLIEPTSVCNLRCPMCFQTDSTFTTSEFMGRMQPELFQRIISMCEEASIDAITLASRGEPTLHPQIATLIRSLEGKFLEKKFNTNATRLTPDISQALLDSGFNHIVFSVDSHKKEEYEYLRKGAKFEEISTNIAAFWELRNSLQYSQLDVRVSISGVSTLPSQDEAEFSKYWSAYCDEAYLYPAEDRWDTYNNTLTPDLVDSCIYPWERLYIWHDGTVNPCDVDYKSKLSVGNVLDYSSLSEIWKMYDKLRDLHLSGRRSDAFPCDRCGVSHCKS